MDVSVRQTAYNEVPALRKSEAVDHRIKSQEFAIIRRFVFQRNQTLVNGNDNSLILHRSDHIRIFDALKWGEQKE